MSDRLSQMLVFRVVEDARLWLYLYVSNREEERNMQMNYCITNSYLFYLRRPLFCEVSP